MIIFWVIENVVVYNVIYDVIISRYINFFEIGLYVVMVGFEFIEFIFFCFCFCSVD